MKIAYSLLLVFLIFSCKENPKNKYTPLDADEDPIAKAQHAKQVMENKCYVCHNPSSSEKNRVGPPMAAIKAMYKKNTEEREEFIAAMWNFLEAPSKDKTMLKGAVKRFGVMPYQKYKQEEIQAIAAFMYDYQIEEPDWFKAHWEEKHGGEYQQEGKLLADADENPKDYANIGMQYAKSTKAELGKNLMGAIQNEGVIHALEFCNVQAMPITDSMAQQHQAKIKRVSDKNRNPSNAANQTELIHLNALKEQIQNDEEPSPIVEESEEYVQFYFPILTNDMCLKCHGKPNQHIAKETYDKILELYPEDLAIDYDINEVRGIWSIEFEKE